MHYKKVNNVYYIKLYRENFLENITLGVFWCGLINIVTGSRKGLDVV